jgi:hypothetical protein
MSVLPAEVDFTKPRELPHSTRCVSLVSVPQQGSGSFSAGQQVTFPLVQYGYIVPDSMVVSSILTYTAGAGANANDTTAILGACPASAWVQRLDTQINSQTIETINNYNSLYNMLVNAKCNVADKLGLSKPFGLSFSTNSTTAASAPGLSNGDAAVEAGAAAGTKTIKGSFPLGCIYSSASKFIPLSMGDHRITLTIDSLANFSIGYGTNTTSNLAVSQIQLNYDVILFDEATDALIMSQADGAGDIYLKSQSYAISSSPIANGFLGQTEIPYAQSLTSIKSLHTLFTPNSGNRGFASYDATSGNGSLQYTIAGRPYPETAIDTANRPQYATLEFLASIYGTYDPILSARTSMSVNNWRAVDNDPTDAATDPCVNTAKAYFGANVERLSSNSYMLSGVSSMNSNLTLRLVNNTALLSALNAVFIVCYDAVIKYNPSMRQVVVLK